MKIREVCKGKENERKGKSIAILKIKKEKQERINIWKKEEAKHKKNKDRAKKR